jgi:hypothetical protein
MLHNPKMQSPAGTGLRRYELLSSKKYTSRTIAVNNPLDLLLERLDVVRRSGNGYIAKCPAHEDRSPSLSITQADNGAVLAHCFSGCHIDAVLAAVGLELSDLFPARLANTSPEARRISRQFAIQTGWTAALGVLAREATICEVATQRILRGDKLSNDDIARVRIASQRIHDAREVLRRD